MEPGPSSIPVVLVRAAQQLSSAEKSVIKKFAAELSRRVAGGRPFTCVLTTDREMQSLNSQFLGHECPTDVLSFPTMEAGSLGDIAISVERARLQAAEFGHPVQDEIRLLMLHGVLHLIGHDHESDLGEMERAERDWRIQLHLPQSLITRARAVQ